MQIFIRVQGQFRRIAELDSRQAARQGEGHGRPESTRRFKPQAYIQYSEDRAEAPLRAKC